MIEIRALTVRYGRTLALDGIDTTVEGLTGLFGPNGSGKSTLLRVVAGLLKPTSGHVIVDGRRVDGRDLELRRRIGYAGHLSGLYARMTVGENIELFARLHGAARSGSAGVVDALDLGAWSRTPVHALSAGLKRRAAVARALVHDPDVLLLDEPYANLDDDAAAIVSGAISNWHRTGRSALIATHGAKKVKAYAHAGLILKRGRVVVAGEYPAGRAARARS